MFQVTYTKSGIKISLCIFSAFVDMKQLEIFENSIFSLPKRSAYEFFREKIIKISSTHFIAVEIHVRDRKKKERKNVVEKM